MENYAVWHIGIAGKRYKPGDRLPEMDEAARARLLELGAIRSTAGFGKTAARSDADDRQESDEPADMEETDEEAMPEINAEDGFVDEEEEAPARKKRTRA